MKYTYAYKTSDGVRHEASMNAESREQVFAALRQQGIKAIKVVAADGSKANGEIRGVRKRVVVAIAFAAAILTGVILYVVPDGSSRRSTVQVSSSRHQIYGDPAIMEVLERGEFDGVLSRPGDRLLARFAEPGRLMVAKGVEPRFLTRAEAEDFSAFATESLSEDSDLEIAEPLPREHRELLQIVNGMRAEMRAYLANGNGTPRSYWRRLVDRTVQEMQIYERIRRELENEKSPEVWDEKNAALRRLGLRTVINRQDEEQ